MARAVKLVWLHSQEDLKYSSELLPLLYPLALETFKLVDIISNILLDNIKGTSLVAAGRTVKEVKPFEQAEY